jgi:LysR family glycine cleavage system transcriptional activator
MLHRTLLPVMANLVAFEAAARHASISRAAEELHLTQSAVSRQIHQLEQFLGVALFQRVRQRIVLTDGGRIYAAEVRQSLASLATASHQAMSFAGSDSLNLAVLPTFGTRWLIPRMGGFTAQHPAISINLSARLIPFDFQEEPFDAAIHHGEPYWPGAICEHLMDEDVVPVVSPAYKRKLGLTNARDLVGATLLQQATRPTLWADWFKAAGIDAVDALRGPRFEQFSMVAEAAVAGLGVALVPRFLATEEVSAGKLLVLRSHTLSGTGGYYLVYPESRAQAPLVRSFREWILAEAGSGNSAAGLRV